MKLTKHFIAQLPDVPKGKQRIIWDSTQRGLGLRCTAGARSFVFQARLNGRTIRTTVGAWPDWSVDNAREQARELAVMIDRGIDPRLVKKQGNDGVTLGDAYDGLMADRQLKVRTRRDYERYLNHYLAAWKPKALSSIDTGMVIKRYRDIAASKSGAAQAPSVMRFLRSVFNHAQATYGRSVVPENPVAMLTAKRAWFRDNARTDHLRSHEIKPFLGAIRALPNPVMAAYIEFLLLTGARRGEAATLKWTDVDSNSRTFTFRDTKNHTDRVMPTTGRTAALLEAMRAIRLGEYVFGVLEKQSKPTHIKEPRKAMAAANRAAGSAVTVHGLRRTYATLLESLDCPAYPLKALLGHSLKGDVTTAHYTQLNVERIRPWAERYEQHVLKLVGDITGGVVLPFDPSIESAA